MPEIGLNATIRATPSPTEGKYPEKVRDAAKQFEALLIEQMIRSARASGSGDWMGAGEDQTGVALSEMAEQQFAQLLASNGGLGLANLVADGLEGDR
jgi:flagellar protein FlgJ